MIQQLLWRLMRVRSLVALTRHAGPYEGRIREFEAAPVVEGSVVFFGSSTLRLWSTLRDDLAPLPVHNFGFGGGHATHLNLFWRRVLPRQKPTAVVVYAGDNDLAAGVAVDAVVADIEEFVVAVAGLCPVVVLLVKRSPQRAHIAADIDALNARLRALGDRHAHVSTVDIDAPLRGRDGQPDPGLFQYDGLHLNAAGYARCTAALKPVLLRLVNR